MSKRISQIRMLLGPLKKRLSDAITSAKNVLKDKDTPLEKIIELIIKVQTSDKRIIELRSEILSLDDGSDLVKSEAEAEEYNTLSFLAEDTLSCLMARRQTVETMLKISKPDETLNETNVSNHTPAIPRLPKINLPTFNGEISEWNNFHDLFVSLIDKNSSLSDVEKLQFLKTCLKGEASRLLTSFQITDRNYEEAFTTLRNRYDHKRLTVHKHFSSLFDCQTMREETPKALRALVDTFNENLRSLKVLKANTINNMIVYLMIRKLHPDVRKRYELSLEPNVLPTLDHLNDFLNQQCCALEAMACSKTSSKYTNPSKSFQVSNISSDLPVCKACKVHTHALYLCETFKNYPVAMKIQFVKQNKLCFNCLRNHKAPCKISTSCKTCGKRHHTSLHIIKQDSEVQSQAATTTEASGINASVVSHSTQNKGSHILLATVKLLVEDKRGYFIQARAFLDIGSQSNFISERLVGALGIPTEDGNIRVSGMGDQIAAQAKGEVKIKLHSRHNNHSMKISAHILPKISGLIPVVPVEVGKFKHLQGLTLADEEFHQPNDVDILLGASAFANVIQTGKSYINDSSPTALETVFGWVVIGPAEAKSLQVQEQSSSSFLSIAESTNDVETLLRNFWEIEKLKNEKSLSREEKLAKEHYDNSHCRNQDGRYVVKLPTKGVVGTNNSKQLATMRFYKLERVLAKDVNLKLKYHEFMREYLDLNHMERADSKPINPEKTFFLPHHPVMKHDSLTTKLRVVFDASARPNSGISLNDILMTGPVLQQSLIMILLRFRTHAVALCADIAKMYRQILVDPSDRDLQRIVWRFSSNDLLQDYRLKMVTYGTTSASYQATRTLFQLADDEEEKFPAAANILRSDFYMDDLLSGANSVADAIKIQSELSALLKAGGFELRKWSSNESSLMASASQFRSSIPLLVNEENLVKTLGIQWQPSSDNFLFSVTIHKDKPCTKRAILSAIARLFDPLGLISPVTISPKILLQTLWKSGMDWDETPPANITEEWNSYLSKLDAINQIRIPRFIGAKTEVESIQLHGFSDASKVAYGAVVYSRILYSSGEIITHLLCSKGRVTPIKPITIPRLELCAAVLLAHLLDFVKRSLNMQITSVHAWTDSTIVLSWIAASPNRWNLFVANRVNAIVDLISPKAWHHVGTKENPADLISRGVNPECLLNNQLWWNGPKWLKSISTFECYKGNDPESLEEQLKMISMVAACQKDTSFAVNYSSLSRLLRITAYILRFFINSRNTTPDKISGFLKSFELDNAMNYLIRQTQNNTFAREINCLKTKGVLPPKSALRKLTPFLDGNALLRVGGRLHKSRLSESTKHPIILPANDHLTKLIVQYYHITNLHAGPTLLIHSIRQRYWILSIRRIVTKTVRRCLPCFRLQCRPAQQIMGQLPSYRIQAVSRPFTNVGVDYAGPMSMIAKTGRGRQIPTKGYCAIFVCLSTKAAHIEVASDLTTNAFIAVFKRFISRRGKPSQIFSDCGTNFICTARILKQNEQFERYISEESVKWNFNPPSAPHFGGIWEACVKSTKYHLKRVIGEKALTFEEYCTLTCQIEACLNSRPLCPISEDPDTIEALTPGHFLIGSPINFPPEEMILDNISIMSRWALIQKRVQEFWKRWCAEYLQILQEKSKWNYSMVNMKKDDLVLVRDDASPPTRWKLGRVLEVHPGVDGRVRVVTVKTSSGNIKRPITKLAVLPIDSTVS